MSPEGLTIVHITLRFPKIPEVGDKVASSHGQKGIIGKVYAQEDLPTTACGMTPDLIINPHAFPSRMTINYLEEMGMSNVAGKSGRVDATPFEHDVQTELKLANVGQEQILYDGITGRKFPSRICVGAVNYHVLSQFVSKKSYARGSASSGPVDSVRQPVSGRSREGGLRFGEMERDAMIAHGASETLHDRMFTCSDEWYQVICKKCKVMTSNITCHVCLGRDDTVRIPLNFASKHMVNRLIGATINLSFECK
jgi:DNA-directed RNA polymerase beta subunit